MMSGDGGSSGSHGVRDSTRGRGGRSRKRYSVEWTGAIVCGKHSSGSKVFHRQAKRIKLHGAGVVGGEMTDRKDSEQGQELPRHH
jgi:hypothetical protein